MSKCWYCNEELTTGNYCDEHIGICTKCYGSMFQVSNEFVKGLMDKIADLEEKLTESELKVCELQFKALKKDVKKYKNADKELLNENINLKDNVRELKQQLAEKDEEIKQLNNRILISQLQAPKEQILNILGSQCIQYNPDQDKISFAVEQLEKVKGYFGELSLYEMYDKIDNQIKQLKEKKYNGKSTL